MAVAILDLETDLVRLSILSQLESSLTRAFTIEVLSSYIRLLDTWCNSL
jgi:hypothetical protein